MQVLLVSIDAKYIHTNIAIRLLQANTDLPVEIYETNIKENTDDILKNISKYSPDVIGFSTYIWNISLVKELTQKIKASSKSIIIWGGPEASYDYEYFLSETAVDYIAVGESEKTFDLFLHALTKNSEMSAVPGLAYRDAGSVIYTGNPPLPDLANLKSPHTLTNDIPGLSRRIQYLESSRGCPFHCSYCLASLENKVRYFPLDKVKEDLSYLIKNGAMTFKFLDRTFNADNRRAMDLVDFIIQNHRPGNSFQFEITGEILSDEFVDFINQNAPKHLFRFEVGIQSINEQSNLSVGRHQNNEKLFSIVRKIRSAGIIDLHLDLIAGLPYEDLASFSRTFDIAFSLKAKELQLGFLKLLRGTSLRKNANSFGFQYGQNPPYEITETKWLSKDDIDQIKQVEQTLNIFWNKNFMPNVIESISDSQPSMFHFFLNLFSYCQKNGFNFHRYQLSDVFEVLNNYLKTDFPVLETKVLPLMKLDYLSYHKIKPKIWWKENDISRKDVFDLFTETNNNYEINDLYKYAILASYSDLYLLAIYEPKKTTILLFDHEGKIQKELV